VDDSDTSFDFRLGRESLSPLAHRLEKNGWSWNMRHLLRFKRKDTIIGKKVQFAADWKYQKPDKRQLPITSQHKVRAMMNGIREYVKM